MIIFGSARFLLLVSAPYSIYDDEEMFNGTAALELLRGIKLPLQDYMYWPQEGGALVMSFLAAPFLKLFGPNLVAMKLAALLVSLATFTIWLRIAIRTGGEKVAWWIALLFCLAPPLLLKSDLMIWGNHNNVSLLIAATMLMLVEYLSAESQSGQRHLLIWLGLICGFGMFFAYIFAAMLATVLAVLISVRIGRKQKIFTFFLPSFAMGFLPWGLIRLSENFPAGKSIFATRGIGLPGPVQILEKVALLLTRDLPLSPCFREDVAFSHHIYSPWYFWILALTATAGLALLCQRCIRVWNQSGQTGEYFHLQPKDRAIAITWLYCLTFIAMFCFSPFITEIFNESAKYRFVTYRYFLPLYPALFFLVAHTIAELTDFKNSRLAKSRKYSGASVIFLLTLLGLVSVAGSIRPNDFGKSFGLRGYSYERFGWRMYDKYCHSPEVVPIAFRVGQTINPLYAEDYYRGMGWGIGQFGFYTARPDQKLDPYQYFLEIANRFPPEYRHFAYEGLGWLAMDRTDGNLQEAIYSEQVIAPQYRQAYYRGIGWITGKRFFNDPGQAVRYIEYIPSPSNRSAAYYGLGRVLAENKYLGKQFIIPPTASDPESMAGIKAGAAEINKRYREGRYMEGPVTMYWGGFVLGDYWD